MCIRDRLRRLIRGLCTLGLGGLLVLSCGFDRADRWLSDGTSPTPMCSVGAMRCTSGVERCEGSKNGPIWTTITDCAAQGLVCVAEQWQCKHCVPNSRRCDGQTTVLCDPSGDAESPGDACDTTQGVACRSGQCTQPVSYTHLRAHETVLDIVCRLLLEKKKIHATHTRLNGTSA